MIVSEGVEVEGRVPPRKERLEAEVRRAFAAAEPEMVGALAALLLSDAIELRTFDLLGEDAFERPALLGEVDSIALRAERLVELAGTTFALNVARLCGFAQTGEVAERWASGWWKEPPEPLEAVQHTAAVLAQALMVRSLGPLDGYEDGWWADPGPIDVLSPTWELVATLHITRERLLARAGRPRPPLPICEGAKEVLPC